MLIYTLIKMQITANDRFAHYTPFTRYRIRVVTTSSLVSLRSYLLLPLFQLLVFIKFCYIITNLRATLVLKLLKLIS